MTAARASGPVYQGYDYPEASRRSGIPEPWLRRHIRRLPHHKYGRYVRFTDGDLATIAAMRAQRPVGTPAEADHLQPDDLRPSRARRKSA